ncbi:hypothetical protein [Micromonospora sp. NBS 11-29]|uniref:hypothetical protein n=1 Tax=Micromonospora sp. NBS 11-29 TaxID=1960879 RepID=UPI000B771E83|nr:hypothetical protein [Micromonospora sp. NBS 11-29]
MIAASILLILVAVVLLVVGLVGGSSPLLIVSIAASLLSAVAFVAFARQAAATRAQAHRAAEPRPRTAPTGPFPDEPMSPVPHHTSTAGAGGPGWRQPPGSPVTEPDDPPFDDPPHDERPFDDRPYDGPRHDDRPFDDPRFDADAPVAGAYPPGGEPYSPPAPRDAPAAAEASEPTSPAAGGPFDGEPSAEFLTAGQVARLVRLPDEVRVVDGQPRFHLPDCPHLVGRTDESLPVAEAVGLGFTPCAHCAAATTLLTEARPR